jgi:formate--tetrahydrofolate ligase
LLTDIEIAQAAKLKSIQGMATSLSIAEKHWAPYGRYKGKIRQSFLKELEHEPDGKLILVTAMTPTSRGEGKTLTSIGLGQALGKIGKKGMVAIREPSLGPVFGIKGGAAGGGYSQILPMADINLHFNGDIHAISAAHNLLTAILDNHIYQGNDLNIDVTNILWNRTMDMNDRALRKTVIGLGGRINGVPRESGFVITAASEVMAILALAESRADLKHRLGDIVVAYNQERKVVRARDLGAHEAMSVVLYKAINPNLVQTIEHTPALVHAGPFANIAHGTSSVTAARMGLKLADYVVTEAGFGADLGAEKFFDIVCRGSGLSPSAIVIVATSRALKVHGGVAEKTPELLEEENMDAFNKGLENLRVHVENMKKFGPPVIVTLNRFPYDGEKELQSLSGFCDELGVGFQPHDAFLKGGEGAAALAETVVAAADAYEGGTPNYVYDLDDHIKIKVQKIAKEIYRADDVYFERRARLKINRFIKNGYGQLPVCVAKTQSSLSDKKGAKGVPTDWTLTVTDANLSAGAGFIVVICGDMMLMPGLPKVPAAARMTIDNDGNITGLF